MSSPAVVLTSLNRILHERQLEEYYCTLCYEAFDLKRRTVALANSGLPFPVRVRGTQVEQLQMPGLPLGSFSMSTYDEISLDLQPGDVFVFCSDGISETFNAIGEEFTSSRVMEVTLANRERPARDIVQAIFGAVQSFRGDARQTDDQTVVVVKILAAESGKEGKPAKTQ
jgi:sigma-B regulation protein RsbU (phosphoserine phosphatase)